MPSPTPTHNASNATVSGRTASQGSFQFTLRGLLVAIAVASVCLALVAAKGLGTLPFSSGVLLSWLSWRGLLARLQTTAARPKMFLSAWLLVGISLFLPAFGGCGTTVSGWESAYLCAGIQIEVVQHTVNQPAGEYPQIFSSQSVCFSLLNLANVMFLLSPWTLWRLSRQKGQLLVAIQALALPAVWLVSIDSVSSFRIGYYVWCLGLTQLYLANRVRTRTFMLMLMMAVLLWFMWDIQ